jgi:hypothetical protein
MLHCARNPNNHCDHLDNFSTNHDILVHVQHLWHLASGTTRQNSIGDCPLRTENNFEKTDKVDLTTSTIVMDRCSWFCELTTGVSLLAPILKQSVPLQQSVYGTQI